MKKITASQVIILIILILITITCIYPFVYILAGSFNDGLDYEFGGVWLFPRKFTLENYKIVFQDSRLYTSMLNTVIVTISGVFVSLLTTSCVSYALASKGLPARKFFWIFNIVTMFFNGGMVLNYMLILSIGLFDKFLVYIIPNAYSVYNMIVLTRFFGGIDDGIRESAVIDGASEVRIWLSLYMPLSKAALATVGLWVAVARWNAYMPTLIYTSKSEDMWTLQYYLMRVLQEVSAPDMEGQVVSQKTISYAAIIVAVLPIVAFYPLISKNFSKGVMAGSIKG